jgi:hypothetical protein
MPDTTDETLISEYRRLMKKGKKSGNFSGLSVLQHQKTIAQLIAKHGARTLLDYGCGRAAAYAAPSKIHKKWGVLLPTFYDPSWEPFAQKPTGVFDGVICSDVLEHIGEQHIDAVISELIAYADKFIFASVCCRAAKKTFADGTNMHVTIKPYAWWHAKFIKLWDGGAEITLIETQ